MDGNETYETGGAKHSSHGDSYQQAVLTLLFLRSIKGEDFSIATEIRKWGKFDDIVLRYTRKGKSIFRAIQVKHKSKPELSRITLALIASNNEQFGLGSYFKSFLDIFYCLTEEEKVEDLILFSNVNIKEKDVTRIEDKQLSVMDSFAYKVDSKGNEVTDSLLLTKLLGFKRESVAWNIWKTYLISKIPKDTNFKGRIEEAAESFLQKFYFALNQPSLGDIKEYVKHELKSHGIKNLEQAYNSLYLEIQSWVRNEKGYYLKTRHAMDLITRLKTAEGRFEFQIDKPVSNFSGRNYQLNQLEHLIELGINVIVITGMGGVGKTQLVRRFIESKLEAFDSFVWINSETEYSLLESLHRLAFEKLNIQGKDSNGEKKKTVSILEEINDTLRKGKSLVVYDNVPSCDVEYFEDLSLGRVRSILSGACLSIVTSRSRSWPDIEPLELKAWSKEEALEFMTSSLGEIAKSSDEVEQLHRLLDGHPLTTQISMSYIKKKARDREKFKEFYTIKNYIADCEKYPGNLIDQKNSQFTHQDYSFSTRWIVLMSMHYLKNNKYWKLMERIINMLSCMTPDSTSFEEIAISFGNESKDDIRESILLLDEFNLIDFKDGVIKVHRLVHLIWSILLYESSREEEFLEWLLQNSSHFHTINRIRLWNKSIKYDRILRNNLKILVPLMHQIQNEMRFKEGYEILKYTLNRLKDLPEKNDEIMIGMIHLEALFALRTGLCDETEKNLRSLSESLSKNHLEESQIFLDTKLILGHAVSGIGDAEKALKLYEEVYETQKKMHGEDDARTLYSRQIIGAELLDLGRVEESLAVLQECYERMRIIDVEDTPNTLYIKHKIGLALFKLGELEQSIQMLKESCETEVSGEGRPFTFLTKFYIANILYERGEIKESLIMLEECYEGLKKITGEDNHVTLGVKRVIGSTLKVLGQENESLKVFRECYESHKRIAGEQHRDTLYAKYRVGELLLRMDRIAESLLVLKKCYEDQKRALGEDHLDVLLTKDKIEQALQKMDKVNDTTSTVQNEVES